MPRSYPGNGWRHLRQLFGAGTAVGLTDRQLLERFACGSGPSDSTTAAFETLLARHGSMVLAVCRQVLGRSARGRRCISGHVPRVGSPGRVAAVARGWFTGPMASWRCLQDRHEVAHNLGPAAGTGASSCRRGIGAIFNPHRI